MKVFVCLAAILLTSVSAIPAAWPKVHLTEVNAEVLAQVEQFSKMFNTFESVNARKPIQNVNDYVDMIMNQIASFLVKFGFDPMPLSDKKLSTYISGSDVEVKLTNGRVYNASAIYRDGDVGFFYRDRKLVINVPMFFKLFRINYDYDISESYTEDHLKGKLAGDVVIVDINLTVQLNFLEKQITLKSFEISNIGAVNVKFDGDMTEKIKYGVTEFISKQLTSEVEQIINTLCNFTLRSVFDIINQVMEGITPRMQD